MAAALILTETDLKRCVSLDRETIAVVESAFVALAKGGVQMPPVLSLLIEEFNGEVDVKAAYIPGKPSFAVKIAPGFFDNHKLGLPSLHSLIGLFSARTGQVECIFLDNGYLTGLRTAAAGAVAADHLARRNAGKAGVVGTGKQARLQIQALIQVRPLTQLLVWGRDPEKAERYAREMSPVLGLEVSVAGSVEALVRNSDIVVTTTASRTPLIRAEWLHPGLHITAMGADTEEKAELDARILAQADRFVCDRRQQSLTVGELRHAVQKGHAPAEEHVAELGDVIIGKRPGRSSEADVTVCDLTGTGVQDTVICIHAFEIARRAGLGLSLAS
ncbi:cyclodeaminase [Hypericibacter sp.]|uniref:cyclodeaminase n=1 Tax=Hypericibacter sp. TaxID=2705401 RepID=UPI003D6D5FE2